VCSSLRTRNDAEESAIECQLRRAGVFARLLSHGGVEDEGIRLEDGGVGLADLERIDTILRQVAAG
jgi:hypothetical protein